MGSKICIYIFIFLHIYQLCSILESFYDDDDVYLCNCFPRQKTQKNFLYMLNIDTSQEGISKKGTNNTIILDKQLLKTVMTTKYDKIYSTPHSLNNQILDLKQFSLNITKQNYKFSQTYANFS
jgi:hypothetical protein